jgi:hypothetical protein
MLLSFLACTEPSSGNAGDTENLDSRPGTDDSGGAITDDSGTDDSGTDDSGLTDDSATDDSGTDDTGLKPWLVPDFALVDLNTASPTYGHTITPRDYKKRVSGWYFIHAD